MKIDIEKDQEFLELVYSLQNNWSNAVNTPRYLIGRILDRKVYAVYDQRLGRMVYSLDPNQPMGVDGSPKIPVMRSNGRNPISKEKIAEIKRMRFEGYSVRSIASSVGVGRGTVAKYSSKKKV